MPNNDRGPRAKRARDVKDEEEDEDEEAPTIDPNTVSRFCDTMSALIQKSNSARDMKLSHVFRSKVIQEDDGLRQFDIDNATSQSDIQRAFGIYYKRASQTNIITAESAVTIVKAYVSSGESIEMHPRFPKTPLSAYNLYLKDKGAPRFAKNDEVRNAFNTDQKLQSKYEEQHKTALKDHVKELKEFLEKEKNLREEHIKFINDRIHTFQRKIDPSGVPKKKKAVKKKNEAKTAFDFFKMSKSDLYKDLDQDVRNKKLLKRFNKLSPEMRDVFESLASASK